VIEFSTGSDVGRYSYPFFAAWFLAAASVWFHNPQSPQPASLPNAPRAGASRNPAAPSKKQR
jgi:hypothetical protein